MKIGSRILLSITMLCISALGLQASDKNVNSVKPALLPAPQSVEWKEKAISLRSVKVVFPAFKGEKLRVNQLKTELAQILKSNKVRISNDAKKQIRLRLDAVDAAGQWAGQKDGAYKLVVENRGVVITANTVKGLYFGVQTLRQLMVNKAGKATVAACEIHDYPAFKVRGFMHDVGRNFQTIDQLKMQIDVMAKHKMNVFHWHLTDHYGWRLESKIYPTLQSEGAFGRWHGKFYTQAEFKDLVDYCWARGMIIIPEFDTPGHSEAFRHGLNIKNMKDPKALEAICKLVGEVCTLASPERMPYIHIGTDEVRHKDEYVNSNYLPALHKAVLRNDREVIGWCKGMTFKGAKQVAQTWAKSRPWGGCKHIDSRSNYVNHLEPMDFAQRMFFQQPCRQPHGDEVQLGGILAYWPDTLTDDEELSLTNSPVIPAMVAYSEAVWKGIEKDRPEYWSKMPSKGTEEYTAYADFEDRIAEMRDRFHTHTPFVMVKSYDTEWRLLGPVANNEVKDLEKGEIEDEYKQGDKTYSWSAPVYGGTIHVKHFFGFQSHIKSFPKGKGIVWANTHIYSPKDQTVGAWIGFNTISTSDPRAGVAQKGDWGPNKACDIWLNGKRIDPPKWKNKGKAAKSIALIDEVYSSREPSQIKLKKGWNTVLVKSAPTWKWVFSFAPVEKNGKAYKAVEGLKFSATKP